MLEIIEYFKENESRFDELLNNAVFKSVILGVITHRGVRLMIQLALNSKADIDKWLNLQERTDDVPPIYIRTDKEIEEFLPPGIKMDDNVIVMFFTQGEDATYVHYTTVISHEELGVTVGHDNITIDENVLVNQREKELKYQILSDRILIIEHQNNSIIKDHAKSIVTRYTRGVLSFEDCVSKLDKILETF
jgi:hypothetical protein